MSYYNDFGIGRTIPKKVKSEVRKRCRYGCVICGKILCQYDHFDPEFKDLKTQHSADGIVLLCPEHHEKKTKGLLAKSTIKKYISKIAKRKNAFYEIDIEEEQLTIFVGENSSRVFSKSLKVGGVEIFSVKFPENQGEPYLLNARFNDPNSEKLIVIDDNIIESKSDNFDIEQVGRRITIKDNNKGVVLQILFDLPDKIYIEKLNMTIQEPGLSNTWNVSVSNSGSLVTSLDGAFFAEIPGFGLTGGIVIERPEWSDARKLLFGSKTS